MNDKQERTSVNVNKAESISSSNQSLSLVKTAVTEKNYQHYVVDQNLTAYLSAPGAKTASGKTIAIGMVAVHPKKYSSNNAIAVASGPVIPFGTVITTDIYQTICGPRRVIR